ncbi:MAG: hypothetical protein R3F28_07900 [Candidatus Kapaibacterium sp.]
MKGSMKRVGLLSIVGVLALHLLGGCQNGGTKGSTEGSGTVAGGEQGGTSGGTAAGGSNGAGTNQATVGIENVPFYGNRDQVKKQMAQIPGATPDKSVSNDMGSTLNWVGGRFDELPVDQWGFSFYRGQMLYASLHYTTETTKVEADQLYDTLTAAMTKRHGNLILDSRNYASKALLGYSEEDKDFISEVGQSLAGSEFRMWTSGDSSAAFIAVIYRAPRKGEEVIKDVYLNWYDHLQYKDYKRAIESYSEPK